MNTLQHPYVAPQRRQQQFHRQQHYCQKEQFNLHMLPFFKKEKKTCKQPEKRNTRPSKIGMSSSSLIYGPHRLTSANFRPLKAGGCFLLCLHAARIGESKHNTDIQSFFLYPKHRLLFSETTMLMMHIVQGIKPDIYSLYAI